MKKKKEIQVGCCSYCDVKIFDVKKRTQEKVVRMAKRKLPEYREHTFELSNESLMRVGVCQKCKDVLVEGSSDAEVIAEAILNRHKEWWKKNEKKEHIPFYNSIFVVDVNSSEEKFSEKRKALEEEKEMTRGWQTEKSKSKSKILLPSGERYEKSFADYKKQVCGHQ
jgi:hypothetical protein